MFCAVADDDLLGVILQAIVSFEFVFDCFEEFGYPGYGGISGEAIIDRFDRLIFDTLRCTKVRFTG